MPGPTGRKEALKRILTEEFPGQGDKHPCFRINTVGEDVAKENRKAFGLARNTKGVLRANFGGASARAAGGRPRFRGFSPRAKPNGPAGCLLRLFMMLLLRSRQLCVT